MFTELYTYLKGRGFDVYSIGQHQGICTNPYIVIKENGESYIAGTSLTNDVIELLIYYPIGKYSSLECYKKDILNSMRNIKGVRRIFEGVPTIIDNDKKAYMTSFSYRKIRMKEGKLNG